MESTTQFMLEICIRTTGSWWQL